MIFVIGSKMPHDPFFNVQLLLTMITNDNFGEEDGI